MPPPKRIFLPKNPLLSYGGYYVEEIQKKHPRSFLKLEIQSVYNRLDFQDLSTSLDTF